MEEVVKDAIVTDGITTAETITVTAVPVKPGEKTDPALLLKSLQEEREEKKRERDARIAAETALAALQTAQLQSDVLSPEGIALQAKLVELENKLTGRERADMLTSLQIKYPALKDKAAEFEQYLQENEGMKLETAAKSFVTENDLLETPARKGLESAGGGQRTAPKTGLTVEEIEDLRKNHYRKYSEMLRNGEIKF